MHVGIPSVTVHDGPLERRNLTAGDKPGLVRDKTVYKIGITVVGSGLEAGPRLRANAHSLMLESIECDCVATNNGLVQW